MERYFPRPCADVKMTWGMKPIEKNARDVTDALPLVRRSQGLASLPILTAFSSQERDNCLPLEYIYIKVKNFSTATEMSFNTMLQRGSDKQADGHAML
jgi:hypothetical protein